MVVAFCSIVSLSGIMVEPASVCFEDRLCLMENPAFVGSQHTIVFLGKSMQEELKDQKFGVFCLRHALEQCVVDGHC